MLLRLVSMVATSLPCLGSKHHFSTLPDAIGLLLRVAAKLPRFLEMLSQVRSTLIGKFRDCSGAIGRIGPAVMLPRFAHIGQGDLRKHSITEIHSMVSILGGREY